MVIRHALLPLLALAASPSADVSLFVGSPGSPGDVWILHEHQTVPPLIHPELAGIQLLPLDVLGRTPLTQHTAGAPHLREDLPTGSRLVLTSARSLYRYRRDLPDGTAAFGFFSIEASGRARPLGELPGGGSNQDQDPLAGRLAISAGGGALLLATTPAAGGDLYELDFETGAWTLRTAALDPLEFHPDGLQLGPLFGAALTDGGLVRFGRAPGAQAELVPFAGAASTWPTWIGGEVIGSADGTTVAFVAGSAPTAAFVYVAGAQGVAARVSDTPQEILDAGYLPATAAGPRFALSPDGSVVAWTVQQDYSHEVFFVDTRVAGAADVHLTRDQNFEDTLNDSGVISFASASELRLVVGEPDGRGLPGIEGGEVYSVDVSGAVADPTPLNLSQTTNNAQPPFGKGNLTTEDGIYLLSNGEVLALDPGNGGTSGTVISVDSAGATTLLQQARRLEWAESVGTHTLVKVELSNQGGISSLLEVDPTGAATSSDAPSLTLSRHAVRMKNGHLAAVMSDGGGGEYLGRIGVAGQGGSFFVDFPARYGPTVGFTPTGAVATSFEMPSGSMFFVWPEVGPPHLLWPLPLQGFLLPAD